MENPAACLGGGPQYRGDNILRLNPNEGVAHYKFVHHDIPSLGEGKHRFEFGLKVSYLVTEPRLGERIDRRKICRTKLLINTQVNVRKWDARQCALISTRFETSLRAKTISKEHLWYLSNSLIDCKHPELSKFACQFLRKPISQADARRLIGSFYEIVPNQDKYTSELIDAVNGCHNESVFAAFAYWSFADGDLKQEHISTIVRSGDALMHCLLYLYFSERLSKKDADTVLASVARFKLPSDMDTIRNMVEKLDSPSFRAREEATKSLIDVGDGILDFLSLYKTMSAEADSRLAHVMAQIKKRVPNEFDNYLLNYLDAEKSRPEQRTLIKTLGTGPKSAWLTKEAQRMTDTRDRPRR